MIVCWRVFMKLSLHSSIATDALVKCLDNFQLFKSKLTFVKIQKKFILVIKQFLIRITGYKFKDSYGIAYVLHFFPEKNFSRTISNFTKTIKQICSSFSSVVEPLRKGSVSRALMFSFMWSFIDELKFSSFSWENNIIWYSIWRRHHQRRVLMTKNETFSHNIETWTGSHHKTSENSRPKRHNTFVIMCLN